MLEKFLDSPFATSQIQNTVTRDLLSPQSALVPMVVEQSARLGLHFCRRKPPRIGQGVARGRGVGETSGSSPRHRRGCRRR